MQHAPSPAQALADLRGAGCLESLDRHRDARDAGQPLRPWRCRSSSLPHRGARCHKAASRWVRVSTKPREAPRRFRIRGSRTSPSLRRRTSARAQRGLHRRHFDHVLQHGGSSAASSSSIGEFDLIVLSELGYYLDSHSLDRTIAWTREALRPGGTVLARRGRRPIEGCACAGEGVHRHFETNLRMPRLLQVVDDDLRLDVWYADRRSVGEREGLVSIPDEVEWQACVHRREQGALRSPPLPSHAALRAGPI